MTDIAKVSAALVKAQRAFAPALKTSTNPHFRSKYADLAACVEAVIDSLNANGIALVQRSHPYDGGVAVETIFVHESGESLSGGIFQVPASKQDAQGYGSAMTYARRYALMAATGTAPEDDDGNAASKAKPRSVAATASEQSPISAERAAAMDEVALYMIEAHQAGRDTDAIRVWYDKGTCADNDERMYLWSLLGKETKLRSIIKANKPKEQA